MALEEREKRNPLDGSDLYGELSPEVQRLFEPKPGGEVSGPGSFDQAIKKFALRWESNVPRAPRHIEAAPPSLAELAEDFLERYNTFLLKLSESCDGNVRRNCKGLLGEIKQLANGMEVSWLLPYLSFMTLTSRGVRSLFDGLRSSTASPIENQTLNGAERAFLNLVRQWKESAK